jgi:hypothetical protein
MPSDRIRSTSDRLTIPARSIVTPMTVDEQLLYESRVRVRQAAIAAVAGVLLITAAVIQVAGPHTKVDELTLDLIYAHKRFPLDLIGAIVNGAGFLGVAATLSFLFIAARGRNPALASWIRILAIIGGALAAISAVAYAIVIAMKANDFVSHGSQTYAEAHHLTSGAGLVALPLLGQLAALLLAVAYVMTALNAMRVGLLTKFMGYLGIFGGVLVMFPIGAPAPIVQGFWLLALGYLFTGRWPSGLPPAWRTGKAERWPTAAEQREQRLGSRSGGGAGRAKPTPRPAPEAVGAPSQAAAARTRSATPKRKRKKRR